MKPWKDLSMKERGAFIKVGVKNGITSVDGIRDAYNKFACGGRKFDDGGTKLSNDEFNSILRRQAEVNARMWGESPAEAYWHMLGDPTYDYRGFYEANPNDQSNPETHWPDTYKTYLHPTFSNESKYSGKIVFPYNPTGAVGGRWEGDEYIPNDEYHRRSWEEEKARINQRAKGGRLSRKFDDGGPEGNEEKTDAIQSGVDLREYDENYQPREMVGDLAIVRQSPHEEGLQIVSPEFDLLTLGRSIFNMPRYVGLTKNAESIFKGKDKYFRQVTRADKAIEDAKNSGLIRVKYRPGYMNERTHGKFRFAKSFPSPMFEQGRRFYPYWDNADVIVGKSGNKGLGWIYGSKGGNHARVNQGGRRLFLYNGQSAEAPSQYFRFYRSYGSAYLDVTNGGMTLPITGIDFLRNSTSKKSKGGRLAHKFDGKSTSSQQMNAQQTQTDWYPEDLPEWGRHLYDSYEQPAVVWGSGIPYVKYEGNENEPGELWKSGTTGILPEVTVTPDNNRIAVRPERYPYIALSPYSPSDVVWDIINNDHSHKSIFVPDDEQRYMLYDHGKASNSTYTYSLLNAIAEEYSKAGVPLIYMLGHPYQETTWGNDIRKQTYNPFFQRHSIYDKNDDKGGYEYRIDGIFTNHDASAYDKLNAASGWNLTYDNNSNKWYLANYGIDNEKALSDLLQQEYEKGELYNSPIYNIAKYFSTGNYNSGDPYYYNKVEDRGRDMLSQKAVQEWLKIQPYYSSDPKVIEREFQEYNRNVLGKNKNKKK